MALASSGDALSGHSLNEASIADAVRDSSSLSRSGAPGWSAVEGSIRSVRNAIVFRDTLLVGSSTSRRDARDAISAVAYWDGITWQPCSDFPGPRELSLSMTTDFVVYRDRLVVAGYWQVLGGSNVGNLAVYDGRWGRFAQEPDFESRGYGDLVVWNDQLIAAGRFKQRDTDITENVLAWDGRRWRTLGLQLGWKHVTRLAVLDGRLIIASSVRETVLNDQYLREEHLNFTVRSWDGSRWTTLKEGRGGLVTALATAGNHLYVGFGLRDTTEAVPAVLDFDGENWQSVGADFGGRPGIDRGWVFALCIYDGRLVAGGSFNRCGSYRCQNVAFWDGGIWRPLGAGIENRAVRALVPHGSSLWCAGHFSGAGGKEAENIARWDGPLPVDAPLVAIPEPASPEVAALRPPRPAKPPFQNGNFQQWERGVPVGWEYPVPSLGGFSPGGSAQELSRCVSPRSGGGIILKADSLGGSEPRIMQKFGVVPGRYYRVRAQVRAAELLPDHAGSHAELSFNIGGTWNRVPIVAPEFTRYESTLLAEGERAVGGQVLFSVTAGDGCLEIEQVLVEEVDLTFAASFDALVTEMERSYAGSLLSQTEWDSLVSHYRPIVSDAVNRRALLNILGEMLRNLEDSRIIIETHGGCVTGHHLIYPDDASRTSGPSNYDRDGTLAHVSDFHGQGWHGYGKVKEGIVYALITRPWHVLMEVAYEDFLAAAFEAKGLVIDLRAFVDRYPVGRRESGREWVRSFASRFAEGEFAYGLARRGGAGNPSKSGAVDTLTIRPAIASSISVPVVCLIGPNCRGLGAELAMMLGALPNITLVGQRTGETSQEPRRLALPCGLWVYYPTCRHLLPDGRGVSDVGGIDPDIYVEHNGAGDPTFERALELLRREIE